MSFDILHITIEDVEEYILNLGFKVVDDVWWGKLYCWRKYNFYVDHHLSFGKGENKTSEIWRFCTSNRKMKWDAFSTVNQLIKILKHINLNCLFQKDHEL